MDYAKKTLLTTVFSVLIGFVSTGTGSLSYPVYAGSVGENREKLLATKQCPECDLHDVLLFKAHLKGDNMEGANLRGANLTSAHLEGANLTAAHLEIGRASCRE